MSNWIWLLIIIVVSKLFVMFDFLATKYCQLIIIKFLILLHDYLGLTNEIFFFLTQETEMLHVLITFLLFMVVNTHSKSIKKIIREYICLVNFIYQKNDLLLERCLCLTWSFSWAHFCCVINKGTYESNANWVRKSSFPSCMHLVWF